MFGRRDHALLDEKLRGELEIRRHWYIIMLWVRLGYDPSFDRGFFDTALQEQIPKTLILGATLIFVRGSK